MNIGIYAHWGIKRVGQRLFTQGCHARYIRHFLNLNRNVTLFSNTTDADLRDTQSLEEVTSARLKVVPVPGGSYAAVWLQNQKLKQIVSANISNIDAMYIRLFDPCPWAVALVCEEHRVGLVFDMVGDPVAGIWQRRDWSLIGRAIRRMLFWPEELLTFWIAKRHALLLNGSAVAEAYGHKHPSPEKIISSTLENADFYERNDTCQGQTIRVLYTGVLRPAKRIETLIDAAAKLQRHSNFRLELRIVGPYENKNYFQSLRNRINDLQLNDNVSFAGYVPLGEPLNNEYRQADIYAFPSLTEGAARTLLEASSQSLPSVMTDVGGVSDLFEHGNNALLVPPDDPTAMSHAILQFIYDGELRRRCIQNAFQMAKTKTCDVFISEMVNRLAQSTSRYKQIPIAA